MPAIGDLDRDGSPEIVVLRQFETGEIGVEVMSSAGTTLGTYAVTGGLLYSRSAPVLADVNLDGLLDIIVLTEGALNVISADGRPLPGFPFIFSTLGENRATLGNCGVVVGDIDGDGLPNLVFCDAAPGGGSLRLWGVNHRSVAIPGSPITFSTLGGLPRGPAIADLDGDGKTEVLVGSQTQVWNYRWGTAPDGPIQWGQNGRDAQHSGRAGP